MNSAKKDVIEEKSSAFAYRNPAFSEPISLFLLEKVKHLPEILQIFSGLWTDTETRNGSKSARIQNFLQSFTVFLLLKNCKNSNFHFQNGIFSIAKNCLENCEIRFSLRLRIVASAFEFSLSSVKTEKITLATSLF